MDVSQYLEIFIDETNGHLQTLSDNIMQLEKEPENISSFASLALFNIPLFPVSVAILTPAKIKSTIMYRKLLMVSQ